MRAVYQRAALFVFGVPTSEVDDYYKQAIAIDGVHEFGWQSPDDINAILYASDLGCFPGTHSVIWEQALGLGSPRSLDIGKEWIT